MSYTGEYRVVRQEVNVVRRRLDMNGYYQW